MVLYESHSVIHGRPFPMRGMKIYCQNGLRIFIECYISYSPTYYAMCVGRAFVNVFLHFEPIGPLDKDISESGPQEKGLPPYVIAGGNWEEEYLRSTPPWRVVS